MHKFFWIKKKSKKENINTLRLWKQPYIELYIYSLNLSGLGISPVEMKLKNIRDEKGHNHKAQPSRGPRKMKDEG